VILGVGRVVPGGGVPAGSHGLAGKLERDGALDRAGGAVAGLSGAEDLAGVLDAPSGGVPLDDLCCGRGGVGARARSYPAADRSRISTTVAGLVPKTEGHRQVTVAACTTAVFP